MTSGRCFYILIGDVGLGNEARDDSQELNQHSNELPTLHSTLS